jgi:hypothetical protein
VEFPRVPLSSITPEVADKIAKYFSSSDQQVVLDAIEEVKKDYEELGIPVREDPDWFPNEDDILTMYGAEMEIMEEYQNEALLGKLSSALSSAVDLEQLMSGAFSWGDAMVEEDESKEEVIVKVVETELGSQASEVQMRPGSVPPAVARAGRVMQGGLPVIETKETAFAVGATSSNEVRIRELKLQQAKIAKELAEAEKASKGTPLSQASKKKKKKAPPKEESPLEILSRGSETSPIPLGLGVDL